VQEDVSSPVVRRDRFFFSPRPLPLLHPLLEEEVEDQGGDDLLAQLGMNIIKGLFTGIFFLKVSDPLPFNA